VVKHYEKCENLFKHVKIPSTPQDNTIVYSLFYIEKNGIKIEPTLFKQYFNPLYENFNIKDNKIYTQYNLHTTTGRPSNSFNSINFAALNKDNGCREAFIPENDKFVEIDISAYHPTLAAKLVGYKPSKPIYDEFAEYAGIDRNEAKLLMFRQLYGGVYKEYKDWEFFRLIQEYVNEVWKQFNNDGSIQVHDRTFNKDELGEMNPQKLFNYILQLLETLNNGRIIKDIIKILKDKNTKIVLTVYDSLLLDFDKNEKHILDDMYQTFDKYGLERIIVTTRKETDKTDKEIFFPIVPQDAEDFEFMYHTHPPTPTPGARAKVGVVYEIPSLPDIQTFILAYQEGLIQGSIIVAPEGFYVIRALKNNLQSDKYDLEKMHDEITYLNYNLNSNLHC
jgi:hypothetical protein